jgi:hypothetical protein
MAKVVRGESRDQVQKILEILHRYSDVISHSLTGSVSDADEGMQKGIGALLGINAVMPVEEGIYQLNPRIRSFLSERLAQYSAMQTLTRITEQIHGGRAKWRELVDMRQSGDERDKASIEESLNYTLNEIVYFMGQNLRLLNHQTTTDYGNVESMKRKLRQNHFYADSVKTLINELNQLQDFVEMVDKEALAYGLYEMRHMVTVRVKARMGDWRVQLNDIQAIISKRLFVKRRVDHELKVLYDTVLWMVRNPTLDGFEIELGTSPLQILSQPTPIRIRPRTNVHAHGIDQEKILQSVAARLPAPPAADAPKENKVKQIVRSTSVEVVDLPIREEDVLLEELIAFLCSPQRRPLEISQWQLERRQTAGLSEESWLLYATHQLAVHGIRTELQVTKAPDTFNAVFDDVMAFVAEAG